MGERTATAMVNRSFANLYFSGSQAIGRHWFNPAPSIPGRAKFAASWAMPGRQGWTANRLPPFTGALPASRRAAFSWSGPTAIRSPWLKSIRRKVHELEPRRSVYDLTPLDDHISDAYAENRLRTILLAFFAITAVSLACVGLYGTLSYLVNLRRREVALRLALGALRAQVVRQFLGLGMRVAVLGCIAGLLFAAGFARLLSGVLYGVSATDTANGGRRRGDRTGGVGGRFPVPAIRAARVEPMQALREE